MLIGNLKRMNFALTMAKKNKPANMPSNAFRLLGNCAGSIAINFAIALPAVLGCIGLASDYGIASAKESKLQIAADQAALAAVKELTVVNASQSSVGSVAKAFALEQIGAGVKNVSVDVVIGKENDTVQVVVKEEWSPFFAHYLGTDVTPIVVKATAKLAGKTNLCVLSPFRLRYKSHCIWTSQQNCRPQVAPCIRILLTRKRLDWTKNSELEASLVCAVGGVKAKTTAISPAPTTDCPVLSDPLSARVAPAIGVCDATNLEIKSGTVELKAGRYCGGLKITGDAHVTFELGEYVISDGILEVSGKATVAGENVAFYLHGEKSLLNFTGDSTISLTGAASGTMAGLLFFEDRSSSVGRTHRINSANAHTLTGTIYFPNGNLRIDPNASVAQNSAYTAIIANKVEINEGPTLVLNDDYGETNVPVPEGIRTSSQVVLVQ